MSATRRLKKRDPTTFKTFSRSVLKNVDSTVGINSRGASVVDDMLKDITFRLIDRSANMVSHAGRSTLKSRDVICAVQYEFGNCDLEFVNIAQKAVLKYGRSKKSGSVAKRSGLIFPPSRFGNIIRKRVCLRISAEATIVFAAVVEHVARQILELSRSIARDNKRVRITPRDIFLGLQLDECTLDFFDVRSILFSGANEHIKEELLRKKK